MKRLKTILLFLIICISCFAQNRTKADTSQRVIWEYTEVIERDGMFNFEHDSVYCHLSTQTSPSFWSIRTCRTDLRLMFKGMGCKGWELVNTFTSTEGVLRDIFHPAEQITVTHFVFKRPKSGK